MRAKKLDNVVIFPCRFKNSKNSLGHILQDLMFEGIKPASFNSRNRIAGKMMMMWWRF